jgi:hypothetical protein
MERAMPKNCSTALWVLAVAALTAASQGLSQLKRVVYLPSDEIIQNPERGFTITHATGMVVGQVTPYEPLEASWLQQVARAQRLVFRYFGLKAWRTTDIPAEILQKIDDDFAAVRAAGLKCIPRFTYSADIGEPDAPLSIIIRHLDQLKPILRKNKDVIAVMQAGFIGAWGEWHSSTNNNETLEHKRAVLMKVLEVLPVDRMVQLRAPRYKQEIFGLPFDSTAAIPPALAFSGEPLARVGHHNDCFLADANDAGTYWRNNRIDTALAKPYLRLDNRYVPMGGETCRLSEFVHCPNALSELARMRWSFLSASWREEVIARFTAEGCLDEMKRKLGYRFVLLDAEFSASVKQHGTFRFKARLTNVGWASPFNRRDVELMLRSTADGSVHYVRLPVDPRYWQSGDTVTLVADVGVPSSVRAGTHTVLLNFPDPEASLHSRPEYSIRLANVNTWEPATGYNSLLDSVTVEPSAHLSNDAVLWFRPLGDERGSADGESGFGLGQNYPNPFNAATLIPFVVARPGRVKVEIVDVLGRTVATLVEGTFAPSSFPYAVQFDAGSVASGVYIARMQVTPLDGTVSVQRERKLLVLK